jgi:magnesium-transporting ATPase (P-type)
MCADLGQVKFVLSDKTGTLTKNLMVVQHFSIADRVFGDAISIGGEDGEPTMLSTGRPTSSQRASTAFKQSPRASSSSATTATAGASSHTSNNPLHDGDAPAAGAEAGSSNSSRNTSFSQGEGGSSSRGGSVDQRALPPSALSLIQQMPKGTVLCSASLVSTADLTLFFVRFHTVSRTSPEDAAVAESWLRRQFVRVLVYCNTAMLMPDESGSGTSIACCCSIPTTLNSAPYLRYASAVSITDLDSLKASLNAESPDEVALITAAAQHCGALLTVRNGNSIESKGIERYAYNQTYATSTFNTAGSGGEAGTNAIITPVDGSAASFSGPTERIELLAVNEFDSDRKMMSVLVRYTDTAAPAGSGGKEDSAKSRVFLLCKGADSSVLRNCRRDGTSYTQVCMSHIENFANVGLRTLVAACKVVPEEAVAAWLKEYKAAGNSLQERSKLLSACAKQIEKDMTLLGAIGIEDELQDGVPEVGTLLICACAGGLTHSIVGCCTGHRRAARGRGQRVDDHGRQGGDGAGYRCATPLCYCSDTAVPLTAYAVVAPCRQEVQDGEPAPPGAGAHREPVGRGPAAAGHQSAQLRVPAQAAGGCEAPGGGEG